MAPARSRRSPSRSGSARAGGARAGATAVSWRLVHRDTGRATEYAVVEARADRHLLRGQVLAVAAVGGLGRQHDASQTREHDAVRTVADGGVESPFCAAGPHAH